MPVELLRDGRGIFGIGVSDLYDLEAVAWSCGIVLEPYIFERRPSALILRPDWVQCPGRTSLAPLLHAVGAFAARLVSGTGLGLFAHG
jgi:hypothetical protein